MRIVTTPLAAPLTLPQPRAGGLAPGVREALVPAQGAAAGLDRLARPDALAVTTGQQPGLFTGPLYTVYKALSAAALAQELERRWGRPVVPVFWTAGDDHDYAEARSTSWIGLEGELVSASLTDRPEGAPLTPMYRLPLGEEVTSLLAALEASLPAGPSRDETLGWLGRHYRPGETVGRAFAGAMADLLGRFGVVVLDPTHRGAKAAMAPVLLRALRDAPELEAALVEHARVLAGAGHPTPVPVGGGTGLVFLEGEAGRDRLLHDDGGFVSRRAGTRWSLADLERLAEREPERLSPNVLLRPVVESAILPTVAYVAGPGELAYLPMARPLYEQLGVPMQRPVPRWSGVLVEPRVDRVLRKFSARLEELLAPGMALEARVIRDQLPGELTEAANRLRASLEAEYAVVRRAVVSVDPTLDRPAEAAMGHALSGLAGLEERALRHLRKRQQTELAQIARARTAVLPAGRPQERVLGMAGWLGRLGPPLLDQIAAAVAAWQAPALAGGPPGS